jgi:hypothetical protein
MAQTQAGAFKAWETRRANAKSQKFSDRMRKAWKTRRKNGEGATTEVAPKLSDSATLLADRFFKVRKQPLKLRGLKRACTVYIQKAVKRGKDEGYVVGSIKRLITRKGGDPSVLLG